MSEERESFENVARAGDNGGANQNSASQRFAAEAFDSARLSSGNNSSLNKGSDRNMNELFNKNFSKLDRDGNGEISKDELDRAAADRSIKGEDAELVRNLQKDYDYLRGLHNDTQGEETGISKQDMADLTAKKDNLAASDLKELFNKNFQKLDRDGDGFVTREELEQASKDSSFNELDQKLIATLKEHYTSFEAQNKDGIFWDGSGISRADLQKFDERSRSAENNDYAANKIRAARDSFSTIDTDNDGYLSRAEVDLALNGREATWGEKLRNTLSLGLENTELGRKPTITDPSQRDAVQSMLDNFDLVTGASNDQLGWETQIHRNDLDQYQSQLRESAEWQLQDAVTRSLQQKH